MNWEKRYYEPKPGDSVMVIDMLEDASEYAIGDTLTLQEKSTSPHEGCENHGQAWSVYDCDEVIFQKEFKVV